jgi:hypothetical protein
MKMKIVYKKSMPAASTHFDRRVYSSGQKNIQKSTGKVRTGCAVRTFPPIR